MACLSLAPRGCPGEKDMVPSVVGETRWGLAPIPILCLHEQVVSSSNCFLLILVPLPVSSIYAGAAA